MNRRVLTTLLLLTAGAASVTAARAATLQPNEATSKDVMAYQFLPTFNFNAAPFGTLLSAGQTGVGHDTESLVQFDLSSISLTGPQVTAATFEIYATSSSAAGFGANPDVNHPIQIDLYALAATPSWDENTVGWSTMPNTTGAPVASVTMIGINQWLAFDVTSLVKQWLDGSLANNGLLLREAGIVGSNPNFYVGVFDSSAGANAPRLSVVPEPSSIALALLAVPGAALGYRRGSVKRARAGM